MINNKFYVAINGMRMTIYAGYSCATGKAVEVSNSKICSMNNAINIKKYSRININAQYKDALYANYYWLDKNRSIIKSELNKPQKIEQEVPNGAHYFIAEFIFSTDQSGWSNIDYILYKQVIPHYKSLKKQYKKESNQMFFRETLDGKINLFGSDYEYINECSIDDKLIFDIYQNNKKYLTTTFNKTDCKFDHFKKSVELKLEANDAYTDILNKYKNTYDLIKLAPARNWLTLTKRSIIQIYIQGEGVISNYAGGTYWETDVDEIIDDEDLLLNKYYFAKGPGFREINLSGFNYDINTSYSCIKTLDCWNSNSYTEINGIKYEKQCSIKFTKVYDAGTKLSTAGIAHNIKLLSDETKSGVIWVSDYAECLHNVYRIEIYTGKDGTGTKIYQSDKLYAADDGFTVTANTSFYSMTRIEQQAPLKNPIPEKFNLGAKVIEYNVWARMLCDIQELSDGKKTYDLPYDDFATARANYKKCIGLTGFDSKNSVVKLYQSLATSDEPTSFGMNDFGRYFQSPWTGYTYKSVYPLARSSWANTSLWAVFETDSYAPLNLYENWCKKGYRQYTIKDCYSIGNVIKALLKEIDSNIKHEPTEEFSQFLYGNTNVATSYNLMQCKLYITQKTNILKGEYDQAAQRAEISLKDVMDMLRDCFRCYWYIDSNNRFIIEHVTYFTNGFSYKTANIGIDCTKLTDKFNKKNIQYCQHEIEYDKTDLQSRFEFDWMDKSTDSMSNLTIDIKNEYIQKDNSESITPDKFSVDVDYMLFLPSDFSNDGFALLAADANGLVPINSGIVMRDNKQDISKVVVTPQNYVVSWNKLIYHYILDMPGSNIKYNNLVEGSLYINGIRKSMKHDVSLQGMEDDPDVTKMVLTSFGSGYIEAISSNIDTKLVNITLNYTPR